MASAVETVRRFRHLRVLVIGDAMLDSYAEGTATRLCSEGPVPIVRKTNEVLAPGGAANTAANLAALGADVQFVGFVGHDSTGAMLRSALRAHRVGDDWLVDDACETPHKQRILADGQYVARLDDGENSVHSAASYARLLDNMDAAYRDCDLIVVSDYGYGTVTERVVERINALRAGQGSVLLVDSKRLDLFRRARATVVTPNTLEACRLVESESSATARVCWPVNVTEMEKIGLRLLRRIDAEYVAITMAADGVLLMDRGGEALHVPAHPVDNPNVAGAGDSFAAAMALAIAAGASARDAARIGIDAGGIAVTKRRTAIVHHHELLQRASLRDLSADGDDRSRDAGADSRSYAARLAALLERERRAGRTIAFTNGVFDILHAGHVHFLRRARTLGDELVVGVNSDRSARRLKGPGRPINSERDRLALVAALDAVDHALLFDEETPEELIRILCPEVHIKGGDYADEALPEAQAVHDVGGRIVILPLVGNHSTTKVIQRIVSLGSSGRGAPSQGAAR